MSKLFSFQILKQSLKTSWIWWLVLVIVTSINLLAFPSGFGADADGLQMLTMFANTGIGGNGMIFTILFALIFANIFITGEVDKGTLSIYLNTPTKRRQILFSRVLILVFFLVLFPVVTGAIGALSIVMHGSDFYFGKWWTIITLWLLYSLVVGGIVFLIACWFNKSRYTLAIGALILGAFFVFSMLAGLENFEFLRFFTLQSLMNMDAVIQGDSVAWQIIVMPLIAIPFYIAGVIKFLRKDLHI